MPKNSALAKTARNLTLSGGWGNIQILKEYKKNLGRKFHDIAPLIRGLGAFSICITKTHNGLQHRFSSDSTRTNTDFIFFYPKEAVSRDF